MSRADEDEGERRGRLARLSRLHRRRDELVDRLERRGHAMPAEEHQQAYDELEDVLREIREKEGGGK